CSLILLPIRNFYFSGKIQIFHFFPFWFGLNLLILGIIFFLKIYKISAEDIIFDSGQFFKLAFYLVILPYSLLTMLVLLIARYLYGENQLDRICAGVYLGSLPLPWDKSLIKDKEINGVLNLCLEFPDIAGFTKDPEMVYSHKPWINGMPPGLEQLDRSVQWAYKTLNDNQKLLIHCARGHGRSALVTACLLLKLKEVKDVFEAIEMVKKKRDGVHFGKEQQILLQEWSEANN
ncbi:dual specificity protein phosphatase family protein, partial [Candidatus Riflebacteria bacterium]